MRITKHTDFALRVLIFLAVRSGERIATQTIADAFDISQHHLIKVARNLGELGYVTLHRGVGGGLELAVDPEEISVGAVMRALDNPASLIECFDPETDECVISDACGLKTALGAAQEAYYTSLDAVTIGALVKRKRGKLASLLDE